MKLEFHSEKLAAGRFWCGLVIFLWLLAFPFPSLASQGDLDNDGDVDRDDLTILLADRNKPVEQSNCGSACDLDGDGVITVLDARKLVLLCTLPRCAVVSHENQPPVADAGVDQVIALPQGQDALDVQLDASGSGDPDGTVTAFVWSGSPDPDDISRPTVSLTAGFYTFRLVVQDDKGAVSGPDEVIVRILGPPELLPLPRVTSAPTVVLRGQTLPGVGVVVRGGRQEVSGTASPDSGFFAIPVELNEGENRLSVTGKYAGVESAPSEVVVRRETPALVLDNVQPESGQAGSIVTLTGSGFVPDRSVMGVFFKGNGLEGTGFVLEVTETTMKVAVPFVFLGVTEEQDLQVQVFSDTDVSNFISFHIVPPQDPTPAERGNETVAQFDLLLTQIQETSGKLEQLVHPYVPADTWTSIEENMRRLEAFVREGRAEILNTRSPDQLSKLDAVFASDILLLVNQKLEQVNELLSHSSYGEAACNVGEVLQILNDVIGILDWVHGALYAAEAVCFFFCQPALPVIIAAEEIVGAVLDVLESIRDILDVAVPSRADPTSWHVDIVTPYPGTDPHLLFTDTRDTLTLYTDFTNGGANRLVGRFSSLGGGGARSSGYRHRSHHCRGRPGSLDCSQFRCFVDQQSHHRG